MVQFRGEAVTRPSISVVPEGHLGYTADVPKYPYDVAKAKALLAEAGFPNGVTIKAIHTTLPGMLRSEEHTSELQSLMRISYAVFCLKKKKEYSQIQTL